MERKVKASEEPEGEAPAKVQKTGGEAASGTLEVPDSRLRAEVQSLLVGVDDLSATTVGQVRCALEGRLGLDSGALVSKRRLKRQLSRVVHDEVLRKTQRSPDLARIVKALVEFQEYPAPLRQMLIDGLPHATAAVQEGAGAPHEHQARLLSIAKDALGDALDRAAASQAEHEAKAAAAEADLRQCEEAQVGATAYEEAARAGAQEAEARAGDLEKEVAGAVEQLARAEAAVAEAKQKSAKARQDSEMAAALRDGPLALLLRGDCPEGKEKDSAVTALSVYLSDPATESEGSLITAAPTALRRSRAERSHFDQLTVDCISEVLEERVRRGDPELIAREGSQKECDRLAASAMLDAMVSTLTDQHKVLHDARAAVEAAAEATAAANMALTEKRKAMEARAADRQAATAKRQELDEVVAIVEQLAVGKKIPAEAAAEEKAESEAPAAAEDAAEGDGKAADEPEAKAEASADAEAEVDTNMKGDEAEEGTGTAPCSPCSDEPEAAEESVAALPVAKEPKAFDCKVEIQPDSVAGEPKVVELADADMRSPIFSPRQVPTPSRSSLSAERGAELGA